MTGYTAKRVKEEKCGYTPEHAWSEKDPYNRLNQENFECKVVGITIGSTQTIYKWIERTN